MTDIIGRKTVFEKDGRLMKVQTTHDVEPVIDDVAEVEDKGFSTSRNYRRIGSIPMAIVDEQFRLGNNILDGSPRAAKWCRDWLKENTKFKVFGAKF